MAETEWLKTGEAAKVLSVDRRTLIGWAEKGLLPHQVLPNGYRRFRRADLEDFQRKMMAGATE